MSAVVAAVVAGAALVATVWSASEQANAIEANAEFQGKIAELNAQMAQIDAAEAKRQGIAQEQQYKSQAEQVQAQQEGFFAGQGVEVKNDATGDLVAQSGLNAALNIIDIQNQAFINASKFSREATQTRLGADTAKYNAAIQSRATLNSGYASAIAQGASMYAGYAGSKAGSSSKGTK